MKDKFAFIFIIWLFAVSFFLRVQKVDHYVSFHQDQVRDLNFVRQEFESGSPILLGPKASVGNFYLPPFWYYLMSASYAVSRSPLAPAVMTALLNSLGAVFMFLFLQKAAGRMTAFTGSVLYAVSPLSIEYSRFAWNPNPIPLFVILTFYFLHGFLFEKKERHFLYGALAANLAFQLHYQGLVILAYYFLIVLLYRRLTARRLAVLIIANIVVLLPFIVYEFLNDFGNTRGVLDFIMSTQVTTRLRFFGIPFFIKFIVRDFSFFLARVFLFKNAYLGYFANAVFVVSLGYLILNLKKTGEYLRPLLVFLAFSLVMLYFYKNSLVDFYLLFLIPAVIGYFSVVLVRTFHGNALPVLVTAIALANIINSPSFGNYDKTYLWLRAVADTVTTEKDYCIAYYIFPQNYIESKLRYMVSLKANPPVADNCQHIVYRCDPRVRTGYYICEEARCPLFDVSRWRFIDMKPLDYGVKIYEFGL